MALRFPGVSPSFQLKGAFRPRPQRCNPALTDRIKRCRVSRPAQHVFEKPKGEDNRRMASRKRSSRRKSRSGTASALLGLLLILLLAAGAGAWFVLSPFGPASEIFRAHCAGVVHLAHRAATEEAGVVRSRYAIYLLRFVRRGVLQAGEYRFDHPAPATEVYSRIARGDVYTIALTVPEGATVFDIAARVEQAGLGTRRAFLASVVDDARLVADFDPGAKSLEGYLFPDTYRFSPGVSADAMAAAMVRRFRAAAGQKGLKRTYTTW